MAQNYDNSDPVVLEGVYKSIASSVSQVRQSVNDVQETVSKELQYNSAQQMSAYEALVDSFEQGVESLLAELRYVAQQNSTIYEYNQIGYDKLKQELVEAVKSGTQAIEQKNDEKLAEMGKELERRQDERVQRLRAELLAAIRGMGPRTAGGEEATTEIIDGYEVHDDIEEVRTLAEETRDLLTSVREELRERTAVKTEKPEGEHAENETESELDYDVLAEKIVSVLPEVDYDLVADKVAAAIPQTDAVAVADKVAAAIGPIDENALADKVAEAIPLIDYDLIAERVAAALNGEEGKENAEKSAEVAALSEEKIASAVEEKLDYERIAVRVAELLKDDMKDIVVVAPVQASAPAEEHAEELAVAAEPAPAVAVEPDPAPVVVVAPPAPAPKKKPAPVVEEEEEQTVRYKYSFTAKIVTSDTDVKEYYSQLKNAFLSYPSTASQINWANDRFSYENETIAKVGVRGKTLCLYLALDPYELPESVYHQTFAGDTKMYEKTPTMVKIKSGVALKRALRLIGLLMEKNGAVLEEERSVDYVSQFPYRSEEDLLQEGLVKAVLVGKSESDFVRK